MFPRYITTRVSSYLCDSNIWVTNHWNNPETAARSLTESSHRQLCLLRESTVTCWWGSSQKDVTRIMRSFGGKIPISRKKELKAREKDNRHPRASRNTVMSDTAGSALKQRQWWWWWAIYNGCAHLEDGGGGGVLRWSERRCGSFGSFDLRLVYTHLLFLLHF